MKFESEIAMAQLQTLSNALDVLNLLGKAEHFLSVEEISNELGLPESTTYRLIQTLETKGFIERYSRKKIGLGSNLINLTRTLYDRLDKELIIVSTSCMEEVCKATKETTILSVRAGLYSKCIKSISSKYIIRFVPEDNRLLKLNIGASSIVILAHEDSKIISMVMDTLPQEEREQLDKKLEEIRKTGYAITCNQYDISAVGIAVPIFNTFGRIYASLAIVGPDSRVKPECYEHYIDILKKNGKEITEKLQQKE